MRGFQCFASSPDAVTYRAQLHATTNTTVQELLRIIEQWVHSGKSLTIQLRLTVVDSSCDVQISSFAEMECRSGNKESGGVIGGAIVGVVMTVAMVATGVVVVILLHKYYPTLFKCKSADSK